MLGDDPDPSVTTTRVGFRTISGRAGGGRWLCREGQTVRQQRIKNPVGLGTVNEDKGNAATTNECKFLKHDGNECRCNADDAMMNATNK